MNSLRWRLLAVTLLVVFLPVWWINRESLRFFDRFSSRVQEEHMRETAFAAGELLRRMPQDLPGEWIRLAGTLRPIAVRAGTRFRVYDRAGDLRIDTDAAGDPAPAPVPAIVTAALSGQYRAAWELTPDRQYIWYHCAEPVRQDDRVEGVVMLSRNTNPIIKAIREMQGHQRAATALALAAAALASGLVAWTLTRRLRRLARSATALAEGRSTALEPLPGKDEIAELSRAFSRMTAELDRRNRYNRDFVSSMVHELRAPLTSIRGAAESLQGSAMDNPEARGLFLRNIVHQNARMTRLVSELNQLIRIDTESALAPREPVDLCALARSLAESAEATFEPPRARLSLDLPAGPVWVGANAAQLEQIILNLLENAFRYTPVDGDVGLRVRVADPDAELQVVDTGPGISPSNLPKIFNRFFTTVPKDLQREYGSGLGLSIARTLAESHAGTLTAESPPGQGAVFTLKLPRLRG